MQNMNKHLADTITGFRLIGSVTLLFFDTLSLPFYIIYLICGFSDMIDGAIARKMNSVTIVGSKLDTVADFIFIVVCAVKMLPIINIPVWIWIWIAIIAIIKFSNIVLGFVYKKKFVVLHTVMNKAAGLFLFLLPFILQFVKTIYNLAVVCAVITVAAIQESYYISQLKQI